MEILRYCRKCRMKRYFVDAYTLNYRTGFNEEGWYCTDCNWKLPRNPKIEVE